MGADKLKQILESHRLWLDGEEAGERADLRGADLYEADLYEANLYEANLTINLNNIKAIMGAQY